MHSLSYTTSGAGGHPVVFLHGFMGSSADWKNVADELGGDFRAIAVDLPGHGNSLGLPDDTYTMEGSANALLRTLDEIGVETASIAGYSMGGRLALYFALRFPERCGTLFLESASPGLKSKEERAARCHSDEEKAARLETGDFEMFLEEWYRQPLFATLDEKTAESLIERRKRNDPRELARSLRGMGAGSQPPLWDKLEDLRVPTLAVAGGMDAKFAGIARRMAGVSPNVSAGVVPGAGHNVHLEVPGAYISFLRGFISRFGGG